MRNGFLVCLMLVAMDYFPAAVAAGELKLAKTVRFAQIEDAEQKQEDPESKLKTWAASVVEPKANIAYLGFVFKIKKPEGKGELVTLRKANYSFADLVESMEEVKIYLSYGEDDLRWEIHGRGMRSGSPIVGGGTTWGSSRGLKDAPKVKVEDKLEWQVGKDIVLLRTHAPADDGAGDAAEQRVYTVSIRVATGRFRKKKAPKTDKGDAIPRAPLPPKSSSGNENDGSEAESDRETAE